jgi:hypothetical protein
MRDTNTFAKFEVKLIFPGMQVASSAGRDGIRTGLFFQVAGIAEPVKVGTHL